ncbi:actin-like protein, putative [Trypanosoma equiperdum]|uniref:Actin-like protein, putative n=3 Tax=Trypanozoon TaxID=39700 RepID=Q57ZL0_TRYB2|nr:actin-like protein, putative [Trypanosoma brucei brucei TREU927]AAX79472.1 actin-like protein, putative [Trypanosoma brucei]AAZ10336.1 actin-like protein, putative [Trypanosoma brucei brucei TREU927]ABF58712.1 ALP6 [Trypanosoma brucei]SCU72854.1 actin-like protein, putative [Trypanosoma equiperdum]
MDATCVIDYGSHTVKHTCISKADKNSAFEFNINEAPTQAFAANDSLDIVLFGRHVAELISDTCPAGSALTLCLLTDTWLPRRKRELLLKCCFECLGAKRVSLVDSVSTALFSSGETTGVCVDVGYGGVRAVPVVNGFPQSFLGEDVRSVGAKNTDTVLRRHIPQASEPVLLALKSTVCFVGDEPPAVSRQISLPDGSTFPMTLSPSVCREAGEALLYNAPTASAPNALRHMYQKSLLECPSLDRWVLVGAASGMTGVGRVLGEAMTHALTVTQREGPQYIAVKDPAHAAVCGGAILSQLSTFKKMCVTVEEYVEEGPHYCVRPKII